MKTYVLRSYRHEPFQLGERVLRSHFWIELSEAEFRGLTDAERSELRRARDRREVSIHELMDGRPVDNHPPTTLTVSAPTDESDKSDKDEE